MGEFQSYRSFLKFQSEVRRCSRYLWSEETNNFLSNIIATSKERVRSFEQGIIFWRAQLGHEWQPCYQAGEHMADVECPYPPERMKPLQDRASEGRANPKGIPYLYLATDKETAMSEVRPWVGSLISIGQLQTKKPITLVDFSADEKSKKIYFEEPDAREREKAVRGDINAAFSKPVSSNDHTADYAATQIIAEAFKKEGFDGIAYRSALADGHNIALFDINSADIIYCNLFQTMEINFEFQQDGNPYVIKNNKTES